MDNLCDMRYFGIFDGAGRPTGLVRVAAGVTERIGADGVWRHDETGPDAYAAVELDVDDAAKVAVILGAPHGALVAA